MTVHSGETASLGVSAVACHEIPLQLQHVYHARSQFRVTKYSALQLSAFDDKHTRQEGCSSSSGCCAQCGIVLITTHGACYVSRQCYDNTLLRWPPPTSFLAPGTAGTCICSFVCIAPFCTHLFYAAFTLLEPILTRCIAFSCWRGLASRPVDFVVKFSNAWMRFPCAEPCTETGLNRSTDAFLVFMTNRACPRRPTMQLRKDSSL